MVAEFSDDDRPDAHAVFQRWRADNPVGFFLNCRSHGGWMLHRAACPHPGDTNWQVEDFGKSLTRVPKACSSDCSALLNWARRQGQTEIKRCSDCKP